MALEFLEDLVLPLQELKARGKVQFAAGNFADCIDAYTEAIELAMENPHVLSKLYYNRALSHGKLGEDDEAIADCTKAVELDTVYTKAFVKRGRLYSAGGNFEEAVSDFREAIAVDEEVRHFPAQFPPF